MEDPDRHEDSDAPPTRRGPLRRLSGRLAERLVLHRPETRAWALYDWANSAMYTVVVTAVFPVFFAEVAAAGLDADAKRRAFSAATTISLSVVAILSPILGAIADYTRAKKRLFAVFLALGVLANAAMFWIEPGQWTLACWLFALVNVGAAGSFVFYDALIVSVAREDELDSLSTSAYALGYLGGGLCLGVCLALILRPGWFGLEIAADASLLEKSLPTRIGFLITAVWWLVFSWPFLRRVREPDTRLEHDERPGMPALRVGFTRVLETFRELRGYRQAFVFLLAFFAYNDGIGTVIRMATTIGNERGIALDVMIASIVVVQFVGIPFALLFGKLAARVGAKRAILCAVVAYVGIAILGYRMTTAGEFLALAVAVGMVQGGAQALSRSLFATLVPRHKSGEFFGLFATLEKFAGILGPAVFLAAPSTGVALLALIGFFAVGAVLLACVDVEAGRRAARENEERLTRDVRA